MPIFFTPQEVNKLLPELKKIVEETVTIFEEQRKRRGLSRGEAGKRIRQNAERVLELGGILKDPEKGLVDFPAVRLGKRVYLCWRLGEAEVKFWHGFDEGYAGRKAIKAEEFYQEDLAIGSIGGEQ